MEVSRGGTVSMGVGVYTAIADTTHRGVLRFIHTELKSV